ncbi:MAG TPA: hypothetical protein VF427_02775 [Noviherbaspirillum sp.]
MKVPRSIPEEEFQIQQFVTGGMVLPMKNGAIYQEISPSGAVFALF